MSFIRRCRLRDHLVDGANRRALDRKDAQIVDAHGGKVAEPQGEQHRAALQRRHALHQRIAARAIVVAHILHDAAPIRAAPAATGALLAARREMHHVDELRAVAVHVVEHHLLGGGEVGVDLDEAVGGDARSARWGVSMGTVLYGLKVGSGHRLADNRGFAGEAPAEARGQRHAIGRAGAPAFKLGERQLAVASAPPPERCEAHPRER